MSHNLTYFYGEFKVAYSVPKYLSPSARPGLFLIKSLFLIIIGISFPACFSSAESLKFDHLTIEQGLSQNTVFCILQDALGFMWFGTQDGLNKYNGYEFISYRNNPNDSNSLAHNTVFALAQDQTGGIWIGTYGGGLDRFDPQTEEFRHYSHQSDNSNSLCDNKIWSLEFDRQNRLWIGTENGLDCFISEKDLFTHYTHKTDDSNSLSSNYIFQTMQDGEDNIWIVARGGGLDKLDLRTGTIEHFVHQPGNPQSICDNRVRTICQGDSGIIWIGTWGGGISKYDARSGKFTHFSAESPQCQGLTSNIISAIYQDQSGLLWIGAWGGGIVQYNQSSHKFSSNLNDPAEINSISNDKIRVIYGSASGLIWIGTDGGGLNVYDRERLKFKHFYNRPGNKNSLNDNSVNALFKDGKGLLWIGTYMGGLNCYDSKTGSFTHYTNNPANPQSISNNYVLSITETADGNILLGTGGGGLNCFNSHSQKFLCFQNHPDDPHSLSSDWVLTICRGDSHTFWLGTMAGLNKFDYRKHSFERFVHIPGDESSLSHDIVTGIIPDGKGKFWIGTDGGGLDLFDPACGKFLHNTNRSTDTNSISSDHITYLFRDTAGRLWIGTSGYGLNLFDAEKNTFRRFDEKDGLPNNVIHGILEDTGGKLWISTNKGISMYDPAVDKFTNYKKENGLQSYEFNVGACCKGADGKMYFGGIDGFNSFFPDSISLNRYIPPIVITDFQLFNNSQKPGKTSLLPVSISFLPDIKLSYKQDIISFEFASLCYNIPELNQYAYKLEGFDKDWNYIGHRRYASFTNLPAGKYIFHVKGSNHEGIWNEEGASLKLIVTPPPWQTWWAYTIYALLLAGAIYWYVRMKTIKQTRELAFQKQQLENERRVSERLRKIDRIKDEFIANTSHELRTPLNGIIGIAESLISGAAGEVNAKIKSNIAMIISAGKRLASLVNDILDYAKLKNENIELVRKPVDLKALSEIVVNLHRPSIRGKNLKIVNDISPGLAAVYADENRLQQILHNLIGNAIKFTESGVVKIDAVESGNMLEVSVLDTGIGIPEDKLETIFQSFEQVDASIQREYGGTGLGLAITRQLVELHGGHIRVESQLPQGSVFKFTLPKSDLIPVESDKVSHPAVQEPPEETLEEIELPPEMHNAEIFRILIVDDERINQQVLKNHLRAEKFAVAQAFSGLEALNFLEQGEKFDLILLDIMMPKMSGYEVCQKIREKYLPSELPIIMITAKDQVSDLIEGFSSGANDYIAKPFSKGELIARIKTHLNLLKINAAYGRFVPREFIRTLGRDSILDVQLGDQVHGAMTILFSDIRQFTKLSETMTPKENFDFLNSYLRHVIPPIRKNHGFIDKYIGDAIMALFPVSPDDAVQASIEALQLLQDYNLIRFKNKRETIQIGIGLNTGDLMLGTIGDKYRMDGTVISDAVNLASRIEGLTKRFGVSLSISEHTLKGLQNVDKYHHRFLGKVQVKGKQEYVSVYEIYDGDLPEIIQLKLATGKDFETGLEHYFHRDFAESVGLFKKVLDQNPQDKTARIYLERSAQYVVHGVPSDWQGIEVMEGK